MKFNFLLAAILTVTSLSAQVPQLSWVKTYNGAFNGIDKVYGMKVDDDGSVYVTGSMDSLGQSANYCTIRYDKYGNKIWRNVYNGPSSGEDIAYAIDIDNSPTGFAYVTGKSWSSISGFDYATIRIAKATGDTQWVRRYNNATTNGDDIAVSVKVPPTAQTTAYVFGKRSTNNGEEGWRLVYTPTGTVSSTDQLNDFGADEYFPKIVDVSTEGEEVVAYETWDVFTNDYCMRFVDNSGIAQCGEGFGTAHVNALVMDPNSNFYTTGTYSNSFENYVYVAKGNVNQFTNSMEWDKYDIVLHEESADVGTDIKIDANGNIYVCGYYDADNTIGEDIDSWVAKLDNNGNVIWVDSLTGPGDQSAVSINLTNTGTKVIVSGNETQPNGKVRMFHWGRNNDGSSWWGPIYYECSSGDATMIKSEVDIFDNIYSSGSSLCNGTQEDFITLKWCAQVPSVSAGIDMSICEGSSLSLNGSGVGTVQWTSSSGFSSNILNPTVENVTSTSTYILTVENLGCAASDSMTVYVNPNPDVSVFTADPTICPNGNASLTASGANAYEWTPAGSLSNSTGAFVTASPSTTTTYVLTGTSSLNCADTAQVVIHVGSLPTIGPLPATLEICQGNNSLVTLNPDNTYEWSPTNGVSDPTASTVLASPSVSTTYTITATGANGCTLDAYLSISVGTTNPEVNIIVLDSTLCEGEPPLTIIATGANSYAWSPANILSSSTGSSVSTTPNLTSTQVITVTGHLNGCTAQASQTIYVTPNPSPEIINTNGILSVNVTDATSYQWSFNDTAIVGATNSFYDATGQYGTFSVVVSNSAGCEGTDQIVIDEIIGTENILKPISLELFPNPAQADIALKSSEPIQQVSLFAADGQMILTKKIGNSAIVFLGLEEIAAGLYFIKVKTPNSVSYRLLHKL